MATGRIYTKMGDDGSTGLLFGGRTSKASAVIEAVGSIDEAVAALGLARAEIGRAPSEGSNAAESDYTAGTLAADILTVQRDLFVAGADLIANPRARDQLRPGVSEVTPDMVARLERRIDELMTARPLRPVFVVPGANPVSAALDLARTMIRRAERALVAHTHQAPADGAPNPDVGVYLNRVSDLLFVLARHAAGDDEEPASHS